MKPRLNASEITDLIERFLTNTPNYPQEWNDFVEATRVEPELAKFRARCYELDPLVNRPGDAGAMCELEKIVAELRSRRH